MSEVFDPECYTAIDHTDTSPGLYVTEATYLKLLALYRKLQDPRCTCGHKQASHYPGGCAVNVGTPNGVRGCTCPEFTLKEQS